MHNLECYEPPGPCFLAACWQQPATFLGSQGRSPQYKVSGGPEGQELGRGGLAKSSSTWPDLLSAEVSPGYFDQTGKVAVGQ